VLTPVQQAANDFALTLQNTFLDTVPFGATTTHGTSTSFVLQGDIKEWYDYLAPLAPLYLPGCGNDLQIYPRNVLEEMQKGYFWDGLDLLSQMGNIQIEHAGRQEWITIADIGADPIVVHKSMKDTPVFVSIHGRNQWDFKIVAPTLATFLQALGGWVSICFLQTHVEISSDDDDMLTHVYDEDCKYLEVIESSLRAFLSTILDQEQVNNFLNFF